MVDQEAVIRLERQGCTVEQLAEHFGCSRQWIAKILRRRDIPVRRKQYRTARPPHSDVVRAYRDGNRNVMLLAAWYGYSPHTIRLILNRAGIRRPVGRPRKIKEPF